MKGLKKKLISTVCHMLHNHFNFIEVGQTKHGHLFKTETMSVVAEIGEEFCKASLVFSAKQMFLHVQ